MISARRAAEIIAARDSDREELARLRAEVARLREALHGIKNAPNHANADWYEMVEWMCATARAALEGGVICPICYVGTDQICPRQHASVCARDEEEREMEREAAFRASEAAYASGVPSCPPETGQDKRQLPAPGEGGET